MKYFKFEEFSRSETAKLHHIDNSLTPEAKANIQELVDNLLDNLREDWASYRSKKGYKNPAIAVSSGFRCPKLNKLVGGTATSVHQIGAAADLVPSNGKTKEFISFTMQWVKGRKFDQCINEYSKWVHLSFKNNRGEQRQQIFKIQ